MKRIASLLCLASAVVSSTGFAISSVGNSRIGSNELGFMADVNSPYVIVPDSTPDESVTLISISSFPERDTIKVSPLDKVIEVVRYMSRDEFINYFRADGWVRLAIPARYSTRVHPPSVESTCIESFVNRQNDKIVGVAGWGGGKGVVYVGTGKSPRVLDSINSMIASIKLSEGACSWNEAQ